MYSLSCISLTTVIACTCQGSSQRFEVGREWFVVSKRNIIKFSFFISTYEILVFTIDLPPGENKCNITLNKIMEHSI